MKAEIACTAVRWTAPSSVPGPLRRHVSACLTCQVELARNKRLVRRLRSLREVVVAPPFDLAARLTDILGETGPFDARPQRVGTAGRLIAASAVGATAGVLAVAALRRRGAA